MSEYRFQLLRPIAKAGLVLMLMALATAGSVSSKSESGGTLAGSWSGGGWVSFASGNKERARCHAHYSRAGGSSYELSASCATASGKASQTASVHQTGPNRYGGSFHNAEYNVSGTIQIVVQGNSQSVTLRGDSASGSLALSRR
jgi:hypothetical protein